MPTLKQRALDGRAERRPAHPGPAGEPPREPSTPERSAPGPSQRPARAPGTVADIMRPSAATVGEYDHVAMDVNKTRIHDLLTARPAAIPQRPASATRPQSW